MSGPGVEPRPVEHVGGTSGVALGWAGVAFCALLAVLTWVGADGPGELAGASVLTWLAVVCWVGLVRPRVVAHADHLLLRGSFRDVEVPWHLIDGIALREVLHVHVEDTVLRTAAVTGGVRRARRRPGPLGIEHLVDDMTPPEARMETGVERAARTETRLRDLSSQRRSGSEHREQVARDWAVLPLLVFAAATVLLVGGLAVLAAT